MLWKKKISEKSEVWICTFSRGASCSLRFSNLSISSLSLLSWCCSMHSVVYSCWTSVFTSFSVAAFSWLKRSERKRLLLFKKMYALSEELLFLGLLDNKNMADSPTIGISLSVWKWRKMIFLFLKKEISTNHRKYIHIWATWKFCNQYSSLYF